MIGAVLRSRWIAAVAAGAAFVAGMSDIGPVEAREVGTAAAVVPSVQGEPPGLPVREIRLGSSVIFNERIATSAQGQTQIVFLDRSTLTVGPDAEVILDRFVYDPDRGVGEMVITIGRGVFRYVGGRIGANEGVTINTPTATVGIRGSILIGRVSPFLVGWLEGEELSITNDAGRLVRERGDHGLRNVRSHRTTGGRGIGRWFGAPAGGAPVDLGRIDRERLNDLLAAMYRLPMHPPEEGADRDAIEQAQDRSGESVVQQPAPPLQRGFGPWRRASDDQGDARVPFAGLNQEEGLKPPPTPGAVARVLLPAQSKPELSLFLGGPGASLSLGDFAIDDERVFGTLVGGHTLDFPVLTFDTPFGLSSEMSDVSLPFGFPMGMAYVGEGGSFFALAMLDGSRFLGSDLPPYAYIAGGLPTPQGGNVSAPAGGGVARYDIIADVGFGGPIPFVNPLLQLAFADPEAGVGALHMSRPAGPALQPGTRIAQASLLIEGERGQQRSLLMITGGRLRATSDGTVAAELKSVGSVEASLPLLGPFSSVGGRLRASGGTMDAGEGVHFFGPGLDYATVTQGSDGAATLDGWSALGGVSLETGYTYPIAQTDFEPGLDRTGSTLHGFATIGGRPVTGEGSGAQPGAPYLLATAGGDPSSVVIDLPSGGGLLTAGFELGAVGPGPVETARFDFGGSNDTSFRLDNTRFAAFGGTEVDGQAGVNGEEPAAALVSSGLLAADPWTADGPFCTDCDFLRWGWWTASHTPTDNGVGGRQHFHIGTWVAAELTRMSQMPATGSATFAGRMVGNAVLDGVGYVATGDFSADWSFDYGAGSFGGTFDGFGFDGSIGLVNGGDYARFSGTVSGSAGPGGVGQVAGAVDGAFATGPQGPASGMIGQMTVVDVATQGGHYGAAASFAGTRQDPLLGQ